MNLIIVKIEQVVVLELMEPRKLGLHHLLLSYFFTNLYLKNLNKIVKANLNLRNIVNFCYLYLTWSTESEQSRLGMLLE